MNIAGTAGRTCVRGANPRKADIQPVSVAPLDEASLALCPSFTSFSLPDPPLPLPQGCPIVIAQRGGRREKGGDTGRTPGSGHYSSGPSSERRSREGLLVQRAIPMVRRRSQPLCWPGHLPAVGGVSLGRERRAHMCAHTGTQLRPHPIWPEGARPVSLSSALTLSSHAEQCLFTPPPISATCTLLLFSSMWITGKPCLLHLTKGYPGHELFSSSDWRLPQGRGCDPPIRLGAPQNRNCVSHFPGSFPLAEDLCPRQTGGSPE